MDAEFWLKRWEEKQHGWHQPEVNGHLVSFWTRLGLPAGSRVFVPLCGKSLDMLWLVSQGHRVLGVEISEIAAASFFSENRLEPKIRQRGRFKSYSAGEIEILCGDFFHLTKEDLSFVQGVYDRAALVAFPKARRAQYARHACGLLPEGAAAALLTLEYDQEKMPGPPFSVPEEEVAELYSSRFVVEKLHEGDVRGPEMEPFKRRGLESMREKVYALRPRS